MTGLILGFAALAAVSADAPPKAVFTSQAEVSDLAACISKNLHWLANPSILPASNSGSVVMFTNFGRTFAEVLIQAGSSNRVELRGASGRRVQNGIRKCL